MWWGGHFYFIGFKKIKDRDVLSYSGEIITLIQQIIKFLPEAKFIISGSSFPDSFESIASQNICEKNIFEEVSKHITINQIIYSDRGSARAEKLQGGAGSSYARVDFPLFKRWNFYRSEESGASLQNYADQAARALKSRNWDPNLQIWGTQMISRTAAGDEFAIKSAKTATATRINIHLHKQAFQSKHNPGYYDTDDDWSD